MYRHLWPWRSQYNVYIFDLKFGKPENSVVNWIWINMSDKNVLPQVTEQWSVNCVLCEIYPDRHRLILVSYSVCLFVFGTTAPTGPGPPHSRGFYITHNDTPQSVGLLWTSDQLVAETSTWQHTQHSQQTNVHVPGGIRNHNPSRRATADLRLRPRGH